MDAARRRLRALHPLSPRGPDVPPEFKRHRYLTEGEASGFMDAGAGSNLRITFQVFSGCSI
jgi:hypothetical protein